MQLSGPKNGLRARQKAKDRSYGMCQFCGLAEAEEAHHWEYPKYTRESKVSADHFTALCKSCHQIATYVRRMQTHGYDVSEFYTAIEMLVEKIYALR